MNTYNLKSIQELNLDNSAGYNNISTTEYKIPVDEFNNPVEYLHKFRAIIDQQQMIIFDSEQEYNQWRQSL